MSEHVESFLAIVPDDDDDVLNQLRDLDRLRDPRNT